MPKTKKEEQHIRLAPTKDTLNKLFARSGNQCAFPGCTHLLIDEENTFVAQVCHIEAAMPRGQRFNENSNNEYRRSYENLILLCYAHHKTTDNYKKYPADTLFEMKSKHEQNFSKPFEIGEELLENIYQEGFKEVLEKISEVKEDTTEIKLGMNEMKTQLQSLISQNNQIDYFKEIENIKGIGLDENPNLVANKLIEYKDKHWNKLSDFEKYLIDGNLGLCYLKLGNQGKSAHYFDEALIHQPKKAKALSFAALGQANLGNHKEALELADQAIQIDPKDINAWTIKLSHQNDNRPLEEVINTLDEDILDTSEVMYALAYRATQERNFEDAISLFKKSLDLSEGNVDIKASLATTLLDSVSDAYILYSNELTSTTRSKLEYAIFLFDECWDSLKNTELLKSRIWWITNRGIAKKLKHNYKEALNDFKLVKSINNDWSNEKQILTTLFIMKQYEEALIYLDENSDQYTEVDNIELTIIHAELKYKTGSFSEAIELASRVIMSDLATKETYIEASHVQIFSYLSSNQYNKAKIVIERLLNKFPKEINCHIIAAVGHIKNNQRKEAKDFIDQGLSLVDEETSKLDLLNLSHYLMEFKEFDKAVRLYERLHEPGGYSDATEQLIRAYYHSGDFKSAQELCEVTSKNYGPLPNIVEYEIAIYESIDSLREAIERCKSYLAVYPDDDRLKIRLAFIYLKVEQPSLAFEQLEAVRSLSVTPLDIQYQVCAVYLSYEQEEKGLRLAYSIRSENMNNGKSHAYYTDLLLTFEPTEIVTPPSSVTDNCVVVIKTDDDITQEFIIEINEKNNENVISSYSNLAKQIIGKKVGDHYKVINDIGLQTSFEIVQIKNKFISALQKSMNLLRTQFAAESRFQVSTIRSTGDFKSDFAPIFEQIDKISETGEIIDKMYLDGKIPCSTLAEFRGSTMTQAWTYITSNRKFSIHTIGDDQEIIRAAQEMGQKEYLVLDLPSILMINTLEGWTTLKEIFTELLISQSAVNDIRTLISEYKSIGLKGVTTVVKVGEIYVNQQTTPQDALKIITLYRELLKRIKTHCTIAPINEALNISSIKREEKEHLIGKVCLDSILLAKEHTCLFCSEEQLIRSFAKSEYEVNGVSLLVVLSQAADLKKLSMEGYVTAVVKMIALNYKGISVNKDVLIKCYEYANYQVKFPLTEALSALEYPNDLNSTTSIGVTFLSETFTAGITMESQTLLTTEVLNRLTKNRDPLEVFKKIGLEVNHKFNLLPIHKKQIMQIVHDYIKMYFGPI